MEIFEVKSKAIKQVGYDFKKYILFIKFKTGEIYHFFDVLDYEYYNLSKSDCKEIYFNTHIKNNYKYQKVK